MYTLYDRVHLIKKYNFDINVTVTTAIKKQVLYKLKRMLSSNNYEQRVSKNIF